MKRIVATLILFPSLALAGTNFGAEDRIRVAVEAAHADSLCAFIGSVDIPAVATSNGSVRTPEEIVAILRKIDGARIQFAPLTKFPDGHTSIRMTAPIALTFVMKTGHNLSGATYKIVGIEQ